MHGRGVIVGIGAFKALEVEREPGTCSPAARLRSCPCQRRGDCRFPPDPARHSAAPGRPGQRLRVAGGYLRPETSRSDGLLSTPARHATQTREGSQPLPGLVANTQRQECQNFIRSIRDPCPHIHSSNHGVAAIIPDNSVPPPHLPSFLCGCRAPCPAPSATPSRSKTGQSISVPLARGTVQR